MRMHIQEFYATPKIVYIKIHYTHVQKKIIVVRSHVSDALASSEIIINGLSSS